MCRIDRRWERGVKNTACQHCAVYGRSSPTPPPAAELSYCILCMAGDSSGSYCAHLRSVRCVLLRSSSAVSVSSCGLAAAAFKKTEDTQQRSFIIELETIKKGTQKSAPPARALCLVQALLSSKNGPIDSGPTATSLWYLSASPFLYVCCLSLSIHNVHLWLFALAARDDQRIGFLFAALSSARR